MTLSQYYKSGTIYIAVKPDATFFKINLGHITEAAFGHNFYAKRDLLLMGGLQIREAEFLEALDKFNKKVEKIINEFVPACANSKDGPIENKLS